MSHNTWAHRLVTVAVRPLARTAVTPNQITTVRLITGLAAALAFATGSTTAAQVGGVLWILSMLCDRADGILARMTGRTSAWGHVYDLISDFTATTMLFVAIGIGMRGGPFGDVGVWFGLLAGGSIGLIFWLLYRLDGLLPPDRAAVPSAAGFDPDDVLFIVGPLAWFGWLSEFLIVSTIGAPIAAGLVTAAYFRALRRRRLEESDADSDAD